jgi:hypothetical protein
VGGGGTVVWMSVVGRYVCKCEVGEGVEGQNYEIEQLGLDFRRAVGNGGGYQWRETVGWRR